MKSRRLFAGVFVAIVFFFTVQNAGMLAKPFKAMLQSGDVSGFIRFRDDVQEAFQSNALYMKSAFIDLNGLASKWMGKRVINGTIVLGNGILAFDDEETLPMEELAGYLTGLRDGLAEMDIPFVYVQMPHKPDMAGELLPAGIQSEANWNTDGLMSCLDESGIRRLDMRSILSRNADDVERYFYKTDHHWNFDGAFIGFSKIAEFIQEALGESTDISMYADLKNWEKRQIHKPFLGTQGVRVGQYVAGLDYVEYYVPRFETEMSCMVHELRSGVHADFEHALTRGQEIEQQEGPYTKNAYMVYLGSDRPLISHRNAQAPVKKKILLIKDSFSIPIQAFLSTIYAEIDVLDKRHFGECSIMEYAMRVKPDIVVMAVCPRTFADAFYYDYGYEEKAQIEADMAQHELIMQKEHAELSRGRESGCVLHAGFQNDTVYTLEFEGAALAEGENEFLIAALEEQRSEFGAYSWVFDLQYDQAKGNSVWTFRTPKENSENLKLEIFLSQQDEAGKKSVLIENIKLWKGAI